MAESTLPVEYHCTATRYVTPSVFVTAYYLQHLACYFQGRGDLTDGCHPLLLEDESIFATSTSALISVQVVGWELQVSSRA